MAPFEVEWLFKANKKKEEEVNTTALNPLPPLSTPPPSATIMRHGTSSR
jgi:hypothetical protein